MKFISKLYFNAFKRIGNLRLMFVASCLFGLVSFTMVSSEALDRVYYYRVHTSLKPWEYYTLLSAVDSSTRFSDEDLESIFQLLAFKDCRSGDIARAEQRYLGHDGENGCKKLEDKYQNNKKTSIYSFLYVWNYLWMIFWFYFPFLIVLPIKFIVEGYQQDKGGKKMNYEQFDAYKATNLKIIIRPKLENWGNLYKKLDKKRAGGASYSYIHLERMDNGWLYSAPKPLRIQKSSMKAPEVLIEHVKNSFMLDNHGQEVVFFFPYNRQKGRDSRNVFACR